MKHKSLAVGLVLSICFVSIFSIFSCKRDVNTDGKTHKIEIKHVENGKISCKTKAGEAFTSFNSVSNGTELVFVLEGNVPYIPSLLKIDGVNYAELTAKNTIEASVKIEKSIVVEGECRNDLLSVNITQPKNGKITCSDKLGNEISNLTAIKTGTLLRFSLEAHDGFIPTKLVVDGTEYKDFSSAGMIEHSVVLNKSISVSGECVARPSTFKITIEEPENGKIECQDEDGNEFTNFNACPDGQELTFILTSTNQDYIPKKLTVGTTENTEVLSATIIERVKVSSPLTVKGEMAQKNIKITIKNVTNGKITAKDDQGSDFIDFDSVPYGEKLTFILTANTGFTPKSLTIDGKNYESLTQDGTIEQTIEITKAFEVSGECVVKESSFKIAVTVTPQDKGEITCKEEGGVSFTDFTSCEEGKKLIFTLKATNNKWQPKKLVIGGTEYTNVNSNGTIESPVITIKGNLTVAGEVEEIPNYFKITVKPIENGSIHCLNENGSTFTKLERVREGTTVVFRLIANNGFEAKKLVINNKDYTNKTSDGIIIASIEVKTSLEVSGVVEKEQTPRYKVVVQAVENGSISCKNKKTGDIVTSFEAIEKGTILLFTLKANDKSTHVPFKLTIGNEEYKTLNNEGEIEGEIAVEKNGIVVSGKCIEKEQNKKYKITLEQPEGGEISCTLSEGDPIANLAEIADGTEVLIKLVAKDGYVCKKLYIIDEEISATEDAKIEIKKKVQQDLKIQGVCLSKNAKITSITLEHEKLETDAMTKLTSEAKNGVITFPAVPTNIEAFDIEIEPEGILGTYNPTLNNGKWVLKDGENTLEVSAGGETYTLKVMRVDIELKEISVLWSDPQENKKPKRIRFTQGDYKDNAHFSFVKDQDGDEYLTFGLKEGTYECMEDPEEDDQNEGEPYYLYKATLKTNPPQDISGHFFLHVKHPTTGKWDKYPPIAIDKNDYNDADPFYDDSFHPNIVLDEKAHGMWIPTHLFAADFQAALEQADVYEVNLLLENVTGDIQKDTDENNPNLIKFGEGDDYNYNLKAFKKLKISKDHKKILVHVLLEQAAAKVSSISIGKEGNVLPQGDGKTGFYRYIEFDNLDEGIVKLKISYESGNGKKKKSLNSTITRSRESTNARVKDIKVCGVSAILKSNAYRVTLPKNASHVGKVELDLEDPSCPYEIWTISWNEKDKVWEQEEDITKKENVNFADKKNQTLQFYITPPIGGFYERYFDLIVEIEQ